LALPSAGNMPPIQRIREEIAFDTDAAETMPKLMPRAEDWPFQIDRASMSHGNAGIANFVDVHFHGGIWIPAAQAGVNALAGTVNPAHWAALLGMSRPNIVERRVAWK